MHAAALRLYSMLAPKWHTNLLQHVISNLMVEDIYRVPVLSAPRKQTIINVRDSCFQTFMLFSESKADQMLVNVDILLATTVDTKGI